jgi:hypothetical protein
MQTLALIGLAFLAFLGLFAVVQLWTAHAFGWSSMARAYRFSGSDWPIWATFRLIGTEPERAQEILQRAGSRFSGPVWRLKQCKLVRMRWAGFEASLTAFFPHLPRDLPDEVFGTENLDQPDIGGNREGLYLDVREFWHPALFIPWSDVAVSAEKIHWTTYLKPHRLTVLTWRGGHVEGGWKDCLVFRFRKAPGVLLQLNEEDARPLIEAAGDSWPELVPSQSIATSSDEEKGEPGWAGPRASATGET